MILLAVWLVAPWMALGVWILRRQRAQIRRERRGERHEAYVKAVEEWLYDPEICALAVRQGVMTKVGLLVARRMVAKAGEPGVRAIAARLCSDRLVRRLVAKRMERRHGMRDGMRLVGKMVEEVRG